MSVPKRTLILRLAKKKGQLRPRDLQGAGIAAAYLQRLWEQGELVRPARGIYMLPDAEITEHHSLAEVAKRVPHGVICALSALRFHDLGTENPGRVWLALDRGAKRPTARGLSLEVLRFTPVGMKAGVSTHSVEGVPVRITSPARTIVDCFRYRNKVGLEPALEALREGLKRKISVQEIQKYAMLFRMERVMRPYLEALL